VFKFDISSEFSEEADAYLTTILSPFFEPIYEIHNSLHKSRFLAIAKVIEKLLKFSQLIASFKSGKSVFM